MRIRAERREWSRDQVYRRHRREPTPNAHAHFATSTLFIPAKFVHECGKTKQSAQCSTHSKCNYKCYAYSRLIVNFFKPELQQPRQAAHEVSTVWKIGVFVLIIIQLPALAHLWFGHEDSEGRWLKSTRRCTIPRSPNVWAWIGNC